MRIIGLTAENVKRLKAVEIRPVGSMVQITGPNGAGKTSVLDAIMMGLGGKSLECPDPIRHGAEGAEVEIDLGEVVVKRKWTSAGNSRVQVEGRDGAVFKAPQELLDKWLGPLSFDPLAFSRMDPRQQVETLKRLTGLDFSDLDARRAHVYQERGDVNRQAKLLEGQIKGLPNLPDAPASEISVADLSQRHAQAVQQREHNQRKRTDAQTWAQAVTSLEANVRALEVELAEKRRRLAEAVQTRDRLATEVAQLVDPNPEAILSQLRGAEEHNRLYLEHRKRAEKQAELRTLNERSDSLTSTIEAIDEEKRNLLASTPMPVSGLAFGEAGVTFNGVLLEQASAAEQLRISAAIGAALNPKLRIMLLRDGSLLDQQSMTLLEKFASETDTQIWIERVADEPGGVGIYIEEGEVVAVDGHPVPEIKKSEVEEKAGAAS